jgi:hypothetical protein
VALEYQEVVPFDASSFRPDSYPKMGRPASFVLPPALVYTLPRIRFHQAAPIPWFPFIIHLTPNITPVEALQVMRRCVHDAQRRTAKSRRTAQIYPANFGNPPKEESPAFIIYI